MENKAYEGDDNSCKTVESISTQDTKPQNVRKRTVYRNLLIISVCFVLLFTAFSALSNIQSSLNSDQGLGTTSLSVIYAAMVISCMFVPTAFIRKVGCKWTMVISMFAYSAYIAANFYATWATLIPASILLGMGAAPLWSAKCTYLTDMGQTYAKYHEESLEPIINRFFGIFFMLFQSAQIWGNLISAYVLKPHDDVNITVFKLREHICGAAYCNEDLSVVAVHADNTTEISTAPGISQVYMLCGIYLGSALMAAILLAIFLTNIKKEGKKEEGISSFRLFVATAHHLRNPKQILLIPLTIFSGVEQAYISSDFTKVISLISHYINFRRKVLYLPIGRSIVILQAFVNCALGIHNVGNVMIAYGVADAICSFGFGYLMKYVGRTALFLLAATINICLIVAMFTWTVNSESVVVFYAIAALWGMADAVWQTQINALYGALFPNDAEAAFSNYRLWESIGFIVAFAWASFMCIRIKLWVVLGILILGIMGYLTVLFLSKSTERNTLQITPQGPEKNKDSEQTIM